MPRRNLIWLAAIIVAALIVYGVVRTSPSDRSGWPFPPLTTTRAADEGIDQVQEARELLLQHSYPPCTRRQLTDMALAGMAGLDEYSRYIPAKQAPAFAARLAGRLPGVGLRLEMIDGVATVIGPLPNSPSLRARLYAGDQITRIDETDVAGLSPLAVEALLDGAPGTSVRLSVLHREKPVELQRQSVPLETVTGLVRDPAGRWAFRMEGDIAYVRIREFTRETVGAAEQTIRELGTIRGLVLDLRGNPGGALTAAAGVADMFLRDGVIVTSVSRGGAREVLRAHPTPKPLPDDTPVVVLVDENTASAAEIVAGILRLRDRAVIVGQRTYGKGCVQSLLDLEGGGKLYLTTAEYLVGESEPIGRREGIATWGVAPHVVSALPTGRAEQLARLRARAEVLPRPTATAAATHPSELPAVREMLELDTQLADALKLAANPAQVRQLLREAALARAASTSRAN